MPLWGSSEMQFAGVSQEVLRLEGTTILPGSHHLPWGFKPELNLGQVLTA